MFINAKVMVIDVKVVIKNVVNNVKFLLCSISSKFFFISNFVVKF